MGSIARKSAVVALGLFLFNVGAARASVIEVSVPFPFVVHGQMMPAGQYRLERDGTDVVMIHGERGTHANMFVMTTPADGHDPAGEQPALTFTRHETQYRLSGIWSSGTEGWTVASR